MHPLGQCTALGKEVQVGKATIAEEKLDGKAMQVMGRMADRHETPKGEEVGKGMKGTIQRRIEGSPGPVLLVPLCIQHLVKAT